MPIVERKGPIAFVADGIVLNVTEACALEVEVFGLKMKVEAMRTTHRRLFL